MAIAPQIQIPGYAAPRDLDFSPLAKLAEQWKANQQQQVQQQALQQYAAGDPSALLRSGNMSLAQLYVQDQQRKQDLERQSRLDCGLAKLKAKMMNTSELMTTRDQSP